MQDRMNRNSNSGNRWQGVMAIIMGLLGLSVMHAPMVLPNWWGINWVPVWNANNWVVTWENGFVLRGFVGTIVQLFCGVVTLKSVLIVSTVAVGCYLLLIGWMSIQLYLKEPSDTMLVMILFVLSQPCMVQWWLTPAMFARLDIFLVIVALIGVVFLAMWEGVWGYLPLFLIVGLAMLVHEGFGVLFVPVIFACCFAIRVWKCETADWKPWLLFLMPALGVWFSISYLGRPTLPYAEFVQGLRNHVSGFDVYGEEFVRLAYFMSFSERVRAAISCLSIDMVLRIAATLIFMGPTILILGSMWQTLLRSTRPSPVRRFALIMLLLASLSPLMAFVLGCDYFRWIEYWLFNNLIALGVLMFCDSGNRRRLLEVVTRKRWLVLVVIVVNAAVGAPGALTSYPFVEFIAQFLRRGLK